MSTINDITLFLRKNILPEGKITKIGKYNRPQKPISAEWRYWPDHLKRDIGMIDALPAMETWRRFNIMF